MSPVETIRIELFGYISCFLKCMLKKLQISSVGSSSTFCLAMFWLYSHFCDFGV